MIDTFLRGILDAMRESLICNDGLSPEVNIVEEFVVHALRYKQSHKIAKHFELHCSKTQIVTRAEPQKVGTFWARRKELAGNTNPSVIVRPTQSQERCPWNDLHVDRVEQPAVAPYQRPPPKEVGQRRPADVLKPLNAPWKFDTSWPIGASACFRCSQPGHYANDCPGNNGRQGDKSWAYVRAIQTAVPDDDVVNSGNEPDVEDDEVDNLIGHVPGDNTTSEAGEHPGDEFVKVDVYDNNHYAWESDTEFMGALMDYLASELDQPIGAGNVKVYKVHLYKAPGKLARPVVQYKDKECLASYVEVNGHKLGTVGSQAAVQFGTPATIACAGMKTYGGRGSPTVEEVEDEEQAYIGLPGKYPALMVLEIEYKRTLKRGEMPKTSSKKVLGQKHKGEARSSQNAMSIECQPTLSKVKVEDLVSDDDHRQVEDSTSSVGTNRLVWDQPIPHPNFEWAFDP
ncbi:hypothetical protein C0992_013106 [Termitomyces sp. T32_za158]|nr:hypothetical protein C0992_013106 [Termitomyces sp. T32_za158]